MLDSKNMLSGLINSLIGSFLPDTKYLIYAGVGLVLLVVAFVFIRIKFGAIITTRGKVDGI